MSKKDQASFRKSIEQAIARKAILDSSFRSALFTDARAAVESVMKEEAPGTKLPAHLEVKAIEEPTNAFYVVVPSPPPELSDAQLEAVAGGSATIHITWSIEWD